MRPTVSLSDIARSVAASALMAALAALVALSPAEGQEPAPGGGKPKEAPPGLNAADCKKLPGGNAPINRIAQLEGGLAVENLEMTYFEKKLYQLKQADFDLLARLIPFCNNVPAADAQLAMKRLSTLVFEAQATRNRSLKWIEETLKKVDEMPPGPESIREVHNIWAEIQNRQFEMTKADARYMILELDKRKNRLYDDTSRRDAQKAVSPFMPEVPREDRKPDPN